MLTKIRAILIALWVSFVPALSPASAQEAVDAEGVAAATDAVESEVQDEAQAQTSDRRERILQEAIDALTGTKDALKALEEERIDDALDALAMTTGRLELIVAREPELMLAPTDVAVIERDILGSKEAVRRAIQRAEDALDEGQVQEARRILDGLGSEIVLSVTSLPLATYPDAIRAIAPLIDKGMIEEAKTGLQAALNTLVVTDHVLPLPVLRTDALLARAEELAAQEDRSDEDNEKLANSLSAARNQLEMAELLGYGETDDYEGLYAQIDRIEQQTEGGRSGTGFFKNIKHSMSNLWSSIAD